MPNAFAYLVFFSWPIVVLCFLFRYPVKKAIFISITLALLFLPNAFEIDLPILPHLNKENITGMSLVVFLFLQRKKFRIFQPGLVTKLFIGYIIVIMISTQLNAESIMVGKKFIQGLTFYDAFSTIFRFILYTMPFFLGRFFSNSVKDTEYFFKAVVLICLVYTLPMLYELRMSPQLHYLAYGYQPSQFVQEIRENGYRPMVFIGHGLGLAFWLSTCILAAAALLKNKIRATIFSPRVVVGYLFVILIFCKTWSALVYAILGTLFIYKLSPSKQVKWSFLIAALVIVYPVTKVAGIFPDDQIISSIRQYSPERADSLEFRFVNENQLLVRALEKPFFGWGGWGRDRIYSAWNGQDLSVTDGKWIIELGENGFLGFLFWYAILLAPLYYAHKTIKYVSEPKDQVFLASLAVILAVGILDSIPNTGMGPMHLFLAGALLGQSEFLKQQKYLLDDEEKKFKRG